MVLRVVVLETMWTYTWRQVSHWPGTCQGLAGWPVSPRGLPMCLPQLYHTWPGS